MLRSDNDATNLPQVRGTGEEHFRYFIENRLNYCDSKWYAGDYPEDNAIVRIYTPVDENGVPRTDLAVPANANITVTPYSHMYAGVRYKANGTLYQERLDANEEYTFVAPNETFNDTETAIYGASQLSSLGDLAPLYLGYIDVGAATKLVELKIGDGTEGYKNANLYHLAVGTNRLLKKIDIQNCDSPRFVQALVLTGCPNIEEVYAKGSSITGVELPDSGYLKILQLPATITNLTLKNQPYIEDLTIEGYENIKTITIENCPVIDSLDILDKAVNVERVRLTNVDWHYDDTSILYELIERDIAGIDENGVNTNTMWVDGKCHIKTLTGEQYAYVKNAYPYLTITYDTLTTVLTYMSEDGSIKLHEETVYNGGDGSGEFEFDSSIIINCELGGINAQTGELTDSNTTVRTDYISTPTGNVASDAQLKMSFSNIPYKKFMVLFYNGGKELIPCPTIPPDCGWDGMSQDGWLFIDSNINTLYMNTWCSWNSFAWQNIEYIRLIFAIDDETPITEIDGSVSIRGKQYYLYDSSEWTPFEKLSTAQYDYTFGGWSLNPNSEPNPNALKNVEANRTVYVAFNKTIRSYTVNFYNGTTLLETQTIEYGSDATYGGAAPVHPTLPDYCEFTGWKPQPTNITGSVDCYAQWYDTREITDDWATIAAACNDGTATSKYAIGAYKNLPIGAIELPYDFSSGSAVVWNDEIHILGSSVTGYTKAHYKWNGTEWAEASTLPYAFKNGSAIVYNNEIHIIGGNNKQHYKWNGTEWIEVSTLPYGFGYSNAVVYNDEIHIMGGAASADRTKHYKWDEAEWISVSTLPYSLQEGNVVVYNNEIHIMGGATANSHYSWNENNGWTALNNLARNVQNSSVFVYNNEIHTFGGVNNNTKVHYKYDGENWASVSTLPYAFTSGGAVSYNDEIYIMGGNIASKYKAFYHYSIETEIWQEVGTTEIIPMEVIGHNHDELTDGIRKWENMTSLKGGTLHFNDCPFAVFNDVIYTFVNKKLWRYEESTWSAVSGSDISSVYDGATGAMCVYNGELHLVGGSSSAKSTAHYAWNGSAWYEVTTTLPEIGRATLVVSNGELYAHQMYSFLKWNGSEWIKLSPTKLTSGSRIFVVDDVIYKREANTTTLTEWDGTDFVESEIIAPSNYTAFFKVYDKIYSFANNNVVYEYVNSEWVVVDKFPEPDGYKERLVYKGEVHLFGSTQFAKRFNHYKWSGASWENVGTLPVSKREHMTVVYNNELHILGGNIYPQTAHYKWDGTTWTNVGTMPNAWKNGKAIVYNNEIHVLAGVSHYKWDGTAWTSVGTIPGSGATQSCVVHDGCIYTFGVDPSGGGETNKWMKWDGVEWTNGTCNMPGKGRPAAAVVYNNEIHVMGFIHSYTKHVKLDGDKFTTVSTMPATPSYGDFVEVVNNEIHMFTNTDHYKWDGVEWRKVSSLPYNAQHGRIINFREKLYLIGGNNKSTGFYALTNPRATLTFFAKNALSKRCAYGETQIWRDSNLRTYYNTTILDSLPNDLQTSISSVKKISDGGITEKCYVVTDDKLWTPSCDEVGGSNDYPGQGITYSVFTNDASRMRLKLDGTKTEWYLRSSATKTNVNAIMSINGNGKISVYPNNWTKLDLVPGFCI